MIGEAITVVPMTSGSRNSARRYPGRFRDEDSCSKSLDLPESPKDPHVQDTGGGSVEGIKPEGVAMPGEGRHAARTVTRTVRIEAKRKTRRGRVPP